MARRSRDPFDVDLDAEQRQQLAIWLANEVQAALDARASNERDVDYWHILYEQGRTRTGRNLPWPDAADLTSYLGTEKVDALHARLMRTLWVEPIWTVESRRRTAARGDRQGRADCADRAAGAVGSLRGHGPAHDAETDPRAGGDADRSAHG